MLVCAMQDCGASGDFYAELRGRPARGCLHYKHVHTLIAVTRLWCRNVELTADAMEAIGDFYAELRGSSDIRALPVTVRLWTARQRIHSEHWPCLHSLSAAEGCLYAALNLHAHFLHALHRIVVQSRSVL